MSASQYAQGGEQSRTTGLLDKKVANHPHILWETVDLLKKNCWRKTPLPPFDFRKDNMKNKGFHNFLLSDYDRMIDWKKRLEKEMPLLDKLFREAKVERALDIGSATGEHCIALAEKGYNVIGIEPNYEMLRIARKKGKRKKGKIKFFKGQFSNFDELIRVKVDALICLGNTLAHHPDYKSLNSTLRKFFSILKEKGLLIFQVINADSMPLGSHRYQPTRYWKDQLGEKIIIRRYSRYERNFTELSALRLSKEKDKWEMEETLQKLLAFESKRLLYLIKKAGFVSIKFHSDYDLTPFHSRKSESLLAVCEKP
jgi:glycine/sarcosine N-methyltransferase